MLITEIHLKLNVVSFGNAVVHHVFVDTVGHRGKGRGLLRFSSGPTVDSRLESLRPAELVSDKWNLSPSADGDSVSLSTEGVDDSINPSLLSHSLQGAH